MNADGHSSLLLCRTESVPHNFLVADDRDRQALFTQELGEAPLCRFFRTMPILFLCNSKVGSVDDNHHVARRFRVSRCRSIVLLHLIWPYELA
jgi:hypothetical protein